MVHRLRLGPGEQPVATFRRHWWFVARPALVVVPLLVAMPAYSTLDLAFPRLRLAQYSPLFVLIEVILIALVTLKWLTIDLLVWWNTRWLLTTHRLIEQSGRLAIERRDVPLLAVQEGNLRSTETSGKSFHYGDITLRVAGRGRPVCLQQVPHPQYTQRLIETQVRAARAQAGARPGATSEIQEALARIFQGQAAVHDAPTQVVPRITTTAARLQRQLQLPTEEAVLIAGRHHPIILIGTVLKALVPVLLLAVVSRFLVVPQPLVGLGAVTVICLVIWGLSGWRDRLCVVTTERVMLIRQRPLSLAVRASVPLREVSDVVLTLPPVVGRLFQIGSLRLEQNELSLQLRAMPHPEALQHHILEQREVVLRQERLREQERLAGTLTEWFKEYHRMQGEADSSTKP
jgi:hypothetical protein